MTSQPDNIPLVSVICTCYNHADFVIQSLVSVLSQTYPAVELIVTDNASDDRSAELIGEFTKEHQHITFIRNKVNAGICKAFNDASAIAKGKYLVDLSADDVFLPDRLAKQVEHFEQLDETYGMLYSNIEYINKKGEVTGNSVNEKKYPSGRIFKDVLREYIIPAPSTIFRASAFRELNGYNEDLAFEDFDFWVRCAYSFNIAFIPDILTQKRVLKASFSRQFYSRKTDKMLRSTLATYQWAGKRVSGKEERASYKQGVSYFFRQAVLLGHLEVAEEFLKELAEPEGIKNQLFLGLLQLQRLFRHK